MQLTKNTKNDAFKAVLDSILNQHTQPILPSTGDVVPWRAGAVSAIGSLLSTGDARSLERQANISVIDLIAHRNLVINQNEPQFLEFLLDIELVYADSFLFWGAGGNTPKTNATACRLFKEGMGEIASKYYLS